MVKLQLERQYGLGAGADQRPKARGTWVEVRTWRACSLLLLHRQITLHYSQQLPLFSQGPIPGLCLFLPDAWGANKLLHRSFALLMYICCSLKRKNDSYHTQQYPAIGYYGK